MFGGLLGGMRLRKASPEQRLPKKWAAKAGVSFMWLSWDGVWLEGGGDRRKKSQRWPEMDGVGCPSGGSGPWNSICHLVLTCYPARPWLSGFVSLGTGCLTYLPGWFQGLNEILHLKRGESIK